MCRSAAFSAGASTRRRSPRRPRDNGRASGPSPGVSPARAALHAALREHQTVLVYQPEAPTPALPGGMAAERHRSLLAPGVGARVAGFEPYGGSEDTLADCPTGDAAARLIYRYCRLYLGG